MNFIFFEKGAKENPYKSHLYQTLGNSFRVENKFYDVSVSEKDQTVSLTPNTQGTGALHISIGTLVESMKIDPYSIEIIEAKNPQARYQWSKPDSIDLPGATYCIRGMRFDCWQGPGDKPAFPKRENLWEGALMDSVPFTVLSNQVNYLELGNPKLSVWPIRGSYTLVNEQTTSCTLFQKGNSIYFAPHIMGKHGEVYSWFQRRDSGPNDGNTYQILDSNGVSVVSGIMELNGGTPKGPDWKTDGVVSGKYTIKMRYNTGPFAGILEGEQEITIE
jgi:hypothetical protein